MKATKANFLNKRLRSFTLIELIVVIGIIAILSSLVLVALGSVLSTTRDAQRMANLRQLKKMLEIYYINEDVYPLSTQDYQIKDHPWGSYWEGYGTVPKDPLADQSYAYYSDGSFYQLYAKFEKEPVKPAFACGTCGPDGEYNGGLTNLGSTLIVFEIPPHPEEEKPSLVLASGKQIYYIRTGQNSPQMMEAVIDPLDVKVGETQIMSVTIRDSYPIQLVTAAVETDTSIKTYTLFLIEGTDTNGRWQGSWVVHDTHSTTYRTTFTAINDIGESSAVTLTWTDPCAPALGGDWTLDGNCSMSGVTGVDNGNVTIVTYTMTIQAGSTFAWNPGKSISITTGSIAINSTGQLKQTYLWVKDADGDNYASIAAGQAAQDTQPSGYIRRSTGGLVGITDCYDLNASAKPGQTAWFATNRGDGSYDYNCDESNETQYTATHNVGCGGCSCCENQAGSDQGGWAASTPPACGVSLNYVSTSCTGTYGGCDCGSGPDFVHSCSLLTQACR